MNFHQTPQPSATRSLIDHFLLDLSIESVLGHLSCPTQNHRNQQWIIILQILVIIWIVRVHTPEEVSLIVLVARIRQTPGSRYFNNSFNIL